MIFKKLTFYRKKLQSFAKKTGFFTKKKHVQKLTPVILEIL